LIGLQTEQNGPKGRGSDSFVPLLAAQNTPEEQAAEAMQETNLENWKRKLPDLNQTILS
jgi:hypothetical protein